MTVMVTMRHMRAARMCSRGARQFFAKRGWDWSAFLRDGLPVEMFEETGDAMAMQVAAVARREQE